ncbi:putative quinol monooxygenase [Desulfovibrio ferrophilus]|uniref:ABM domain-containing protein n=1 Tax=Desulfovibrio ferrophilus TaxID=241368 RepID=A0A2Z6B0R6_9BACT|nr:putative quinol monooxygenase [Desulfovibrio ferrophilus]BBD08996.1 putative uncharacterized protein [Desulfovibrio ferrophilus]
MPQIAVTALLTVKPGQGATLETILAPLVAATRAEQGCLSYIPHRTAEADRYCILEQWESQEHLDRHLATAHIAAFRDASAAIMESADVTVWTAFDPT